MLLPYGGEDCVILCAIHKHIIGATFESSTIVNYGYLINAYRYTLRRKGGKIEIATYIIQLLPPQ